MFVHGSTRCKELVTMLHKFGIGLSYGDVLDLEGAWAVSDVKNVRLHYKINLFILITAHRVQFVLENWLRVCQE